MTVLPAPFIVTWPLPLSTSATDLSPEVNVTFPSVVFFVTAVSANVSFGAAFLIVNGISFSPL